MTRATATLCLLREAFPGRDRLVERAYRDTRIRYEVMLYRQTPRLDFRADVDWQERQTMLKVAFPAEVLTPQATYEIQWGNVQRTTHRNTSWDWARFETVAQKCARRRR